MIFVTVGTGDRGFDRLVRGVDTIAEEFDEQIHAQVGRGEYRPENIEWFRFTSEEEIHDLYRSASVVIAHAGAGTLLTALSYGKPVVIIPRRAEHGEHNDDHQLELAEALSGRSDVFVITDTDELASAIAAAKSTSTDASEAGSSLASFLSGYIDDLER